jgi:hypothetical protein
MWLFYFAHNFLASLATGLGGLVALPSALGFLSLLGLWGQPRKVRLCNGFGLRQNHLLCRFPHWGLPVEFAAASTFKPPSNRLVEGAVPAMIHAAFSSRIHHFPFIPLHSGAEGFRLVNRPLAAERTEVVIETVARAAWNSVQPHRPEISTSLRFWQ